jgi:hypothetical protein
MKTPDWKAQRVMKNTNTPEGNANVAATHPELPIADPWRQRRAEQPANAGSIDA